VVRQAHFIAVVGALLMGCTVLASHTRGAVAEEGRCEGTRPIVVGGVGYLTNDLPGCPKGGLLSGTNGQDFLRGEKGNDEVRGFDAVDELFGGIGNDVLYGGAGMDFLESEEADDVVYGGNGGDLVLVGGKGEDVIRGGHGNDFLGGGKGKDVLYGGPGNDSFGASGDGQREKLYCGKGRDHYLATKLDNVSNSCEVNQRKVPEPAPPENCCPL
jgi:hypothetical protein